ncbi:hypothetical protein FQN50_004051 [Emmonsiellopsis sp. PD_5]|nr:hypothetical protein FQN50_004051 [Emmonsiellopsis sp. PD_5]
MNPPPPPLASFTIPSTYDGTRLDCRIYHPHQLSRAHTHTDSALSSWKTKGAIIAHPYAPLGGDYDNPVVCGVAAELVRKGWVVGTFNFRGAGDSEGRTSWSGKPEFADYISVYGFMIHYLLGIDRDCIRDSSSSSEEQQQQHAIIHPTPPDDDHDQATKEADSERMELILAGYSYGSFIVSRLPPVEVILRLFASPAKGSFAAEILQQADTLSTLWNLEAKSEGLSSSYMSTLGGGKSSHHCISSMGSESSSSTSSSSGKRRKSAPDRGAAVAAAAIKQTIERSRRRLRARFVPGNVHHVHVHAHALEETKETTKVMITTTANEIARDMLKPTISCLLISPLLPPVTNLLTLSVFGSRINFDLVLEGVRIKSSQPEEQLTTHRTLVVYGDHDFFVAAKRLRRWLGELRERNGSRMEVQEIEGSGHFWLEGGTAGEMVRAVGRWGQGVG